jgi:DNA-binding CsgD family transcriptional regulator
MEPVRLPEYQPPAIVVNFPASWCDRYFEQKYYDIDPVVLRTPTLLRPFLWDQLANQCQLQPGEQLVLNESSEAGLKHGVSVPLFGPLGRVSVVSFASQFDDVEPLHRMSHLTALAWQFHIAFMEIARPEENSQAKVHLSKRERDCLRWTAEGKSSWDIGMILNISENTASFHIKNAMRKLGTTSRTVAVVKAIRLNLIEFPGRWGSQVPM